MVEQARAQCNLGRALHLKLRGGAEIPARQRGKRQTRDRDRGGTRESRESRALVQGAQKCLPSPFCRAVFRRVCVSYLRSLGTQGGTTGAQSSLLGGK